MNFIFVLMLPTDLDAARAIDPDGLNQGVNEFPCKRFNLLMGAEQQDKVILRLTVPHHAGLGGQPRNLRLHLADFLASAVPHGLIPVGGQQPVVELFKELHAGEVQRVYLEEMMQMFHYMEERDVMLSIDLADGATQIPEMQEVIQECSRLRIAIGHFGMVTRPDWKEQIRLALHPNVMIESGGITWLFNDEFYPFRGAVKAIWEAAELVGMEKLMWGSDYPRTITAITYKMSYDFIVKSPDLQEDEKRLFLGENARKFYGFTDLPILPYIKNMSE